MTTISPCTPSDSATVAGLWNHMTGLTESCWYQAAPVTAEAISDFQGSGMTFMLASNAEDPTGFGFWRPVGDALALHALAGETAEVYYRLMVAYADWGIEHRYSRGCCEISARTTREMTWMNALQAITVVPIGREPQVAGRDPALRTVEWLRVTADLTALRQATLDELGG